MDFPDSDSAFHTPEYGHNAQEGDSIKSENSSSTQPELLLASLVNQTDVVTDSSNPDSFNSKLSPTPPRERWWTSLAVIGVSLLFFIAASFVMTIVAAVYVHGSFSASLFSNPDSLRQVTQSPVGLLLMIVTPQIALVTPCLIAAYLSPQPMRQRLALVKGNWPIWAWITAALATPLVGLISGIIIGLFLDESAALKEMSDIFRQQSQSGFTAQLILMVALTPALCEELLFRGYVQSRLTRVFPPVLGVFFSSIVFAAFHMDPVHVIAVVPLGLFLGWLTWQSGSLFPAILAHFVNNLISVLATIIAPTTSTDTFSLPALEFTLGILLLGCIGIAATSFAAIAYRRSPPTLLGATTKPV
ncbi:CPBP family intramembrane metalloprotease [Rubripirellula sp.]|nr:CPBP family intramembrane glutamic endopeptidase [Rubripirellula sp.]MDB4634786.1 CPBP family intramembrane metalloprotease [Rubripirellula sp.]